VIEEEWLIWSLVVNRIATLREIEEHWGLEDVLKANLALKLWNWQG
jgi:hypothetical protein